MPSKTDRSKIEDLVRRRGPSSAENVAQPNVSHIRSCHTMRHPAGGGERGHDEAFAFFRAPDVGLGDYVIIWEYAVDFHLQDDFHRFLADAEVRIAAGLKQVNANARYRGTYMRDGGGTPRYRTLWSYATFDDMIETWAKVSAGAGGPLKDLAMELRGYWLRDAHRSEDRYVPAQTVAIDERDAPFARMTNDRAKAMMPGGATQAAAPNAAKSAAKSATKRR